VCLRSFVAWQTPGVRWERLFDDLEAQLELARGEEFAAEVSDRTRRELAQVGLVDRLRRSIGTPIELTVAGAGRLHGAVRRVGRGWLLVELASGPQALVTDPAILAVSGLPIAAVEPAAVGLVESRLDFGYMMRAVARDRAQVTAVLRDGSSYVGTVDRVGADFADLAEHAVGEPRRAGAVSALRTLPFAALAIVRAT
jgi:hypothetical protein